jgi:hypothetical protein
MLPLPTLQHFLQQGFLFHLNSSLAEHQSSPDPKLYKPHTLTQTVCRVELDQGVVFSFSPISCLIPLQNHLYLYMHWSAEVKVWMKAMQPRQSPSNVDQESDLKTADVCCRKLLLWVWFWFSSGLLPCTPCIFLGSRRGGLGFQYFKEWQSTGVPKKIQGQRPLKGNLICYLWATFVVWMVKGVEYVTLQVKIGWRKIKVCGGLGLAKWFWPSIFAQFAQASKMDNKVTCAPAREDVINSNLTNWSIIMVGPCGLLVVVSHLFGVPTLVLWVCFQKSNWTRMSEIYL